MVVSSVLNNKTMRQILDEGYEHLEGFCKECSCWRIMGLDRLTVSPGKLNLNTLKFGQLTPRLRCKVCGNPMTDVTPWRQSDKTKDTKPTW